jgi:hypothetical protein
VRRETSVFSESKRKREKLKGGKCKGKRKKENR